MTFVCFLGCHIGQIWWELPSTLNIRLCGWVKLAWRLYTKKLILLRRMICYTKWKTFHSQDCEYWRILARRIHSKTGPWWHLFWMGKWGIKIEIHLWHLKIHLFFFLVAVRTHPQSFSCVSWFFSLKSMELMDRFTLFYVYEYVYKCIFFTRRKIPEFF